MSRIGKKPVPIPEGVELRLEGQNVYAKGKKGELSFKVSSDIIIQQGDEGVVLTMKEDSKRIRSLWGLSRTMVENIIEGVSNGFSKTLEVNGVGYRAMVQGKNLKLSLGFSHDVVYPIPEGITIQCPQPNEVIISGADKQHVGQTAAEIRAWRKPEPYKGKGVKYAGEYVFRKEGKKK